MDIELTNEVDSMKDAATPERIERITTEQAWLANEELQEVDGVGAIRLAMSILGGLILGIAIAMMSGCTVSMSVDVQGFNDAIDGGGEPMGWGDNDALNSMLEDKDDGE